VASHWAAIPQWLLIVRKMEGERKAKADAESPTKAEARR
jgi:hypothetical protein